MMGRGMAVSVLATWVIGLYPASGQDSRLSGEELRTFEDQLQQLERHRATSAMRGPLIDIEYDVESRTGLPTLLSADDHPLIRLARAHEAEQIRLRALPAETRSEWNDRRQEIAELYRDNVRFGETFRMTRRKSVARHLGEDSLYWAEDEWHRGLQLMSWEQYDPAIEHFTSAAESWSTRLGAGHPEVAVALIQRAICRRTERDYDAALADLNTALEILEPFGDWPWKDWRDRRIVAHKLLADCYRETDDVPRAQEALLKLWKETNRSRGIADGVQADIENSLGLTAQAQGDLLAADHWFSMAKTSALKASIPELAVGVLFNHASNLMSQGRYADAHEQYQQARGLSRAAFGEVHSVTATVYLNLGVWAERSAATQFADEVESAAEKRDRALRLFELALQLRRSVFPEGHPDTAHPIANMGTVKLVTGDVNGAANDFAEALEMTEAHWGEGHRDTTVFQRWLAIAQSCQGKFQEAESSLLAVEAARRKRLPEGHPLTVEILSDLAHVKYYRGDYGAAREYCRRAAADHRSARLKIADAGLARAFKSAELSPLRLLALLELKTRRPELAWEAVEESLAGGLLEDLHQRANTESDAEAPGRDRVTLPELQKALGSHTAFVAWLDLPEQRHLWPQGVPAEHWAVVVRHEGPPLWINLVGKEPWTDEEERDASSLGMSIARHYPIHPQIAREADRVRTQRWTPITDAFRDLGLPQPSHLIVLPSTGMRGVPIDLLVGPDVSVSYAPSATIWHWLQQRHRNEHIEDSQRRMLALGVQSFEVPEGVDPAHFESLRSLEYATQEAAAISGLFRERAFTADELTGEEARESRLHEWASEGRLAGFNCLHFATHGFPNTEHPMQSRIICSRSDLAEQPADEPFRPERDSRLTAGEVMSQWRLNADLVVLSACETALGRFAGGEGYIGLSQAFLLAGARSVLVSQWKVGDEATALLMVRFYENLLGARGDSPMSKVAALHEAKHWLRHVSASDSEVMLKDWDEGVFKRTSPVDRKHDGPYASPAFWSAFILVGDDGPFIGEAE